MKKCKKCGEVKELIEFYKNSKMKDGYVNNCIKCEKEKRKKYRNDNKEKISKANKIYRENNKDSIKEYRDNYYLNNKGNENINSRDYYLKNKDSINIIKKERFEESKEKYIQLIDNMFQNDVKTITYIIKTSNFYKIGKTTSLFSRIQNLKAHIDILNIYILDKNIEKRLLREFNDYRFKHSYNFNGFSECFNFSNEIAEFLIKRENFKEFSIC